MGSGKFYRRQHQQLSEAPSGNLFFANQLTRDGGFALPTDRNWDYYWAYGGATGIDYDAATNSLYVIGGVYSNTLSQITIPTPSTTSSYLSLPNPTTIRSDIDAYHQTDPAVSIGGSAGQTIYGAGILK